LDFLERVANSIAEGQAMCHYGDSSGEQFAIPRHVADRARLEFAPWNRLLRMARVRRSTYCSSASPCPCCGSGPGHHLARGSVSSAALV